MSKKRTSGDYEVGYGKPPTNTQFQKGISGNPKGRPRKSQDFDHELIRESNYRVTINESGRTKRISKHEVVVKQLVKQAMTGSIQATRTYLTFYQQALEKLAQRNAFQASELERCNDANNLTDQELNAIAAMGLKQTDQ